MQSRLFLVEPPFHITGQLIRSKYSDFGCLVPGRHCLLPHGATSSDQFLAKITSMTLAEIYPISPRQLSKTELSEPSVHVRSYDVETRVRPTGGEAMILS
jgi:hypothetical protein